jgi:hypothetical protein
MGGKVCSQAEVCNHDTNLDSDSACKPKPHLQPPCIRQGQNNLYPGCGGCWCCKPLTVPNAFLVLSETTGILANPAATSNPYWSLPIYAPHGYSNVALSMQVLSLWFITGFDVYINICTICPSEEWHEALYVPSGRARNGMRHSGTTYIHPSDSWQMINVTCVDSCDYACVTNIGSRRKHIVYIVS